MATCPLCTAKHEAHRQRFHVSVGPAISELAWNSRCCQYARARGKVGCLNPCKVVDARETLEGRMEELEGRMGRLHPEVKEALY